MAKRLFDLWASSLGLLLLAPFLVLMAIAIKLDSPGPVFFRQVRVGRDGVEFRIHKFRTMTHRDAGADAAGGSGDDGDVALEFFHKVGGRRGVEGDRRKRP